jgi:hypothetical protein
MRRIGWRLAGLAFNDQRVQACGGFGLALGDLDGNGATVDHRPWVAKKQHPIFFVAWLLARR